MMLRALALLLLLSVTGALAAEIPAGERRSAYTNLSPETRAMQDDDAVNPATLWVLDGEALWKSKPSAAGQSCAGCHGDAAASMKGVAARYPALDATRDAAVDLEQRINICRSEKQSAPPLAYESRDLLALTAYVARQSRGLPIAPVSSGLATVVERGRAIFQERRGQINMSCAQCHDDNWGKSLAGNPIPQGHPTGYPIYRLEWQSLGSLQRRLRNCMIGMRAEPYDYGSAEYIALEAYLMQRASGMPMESPAVRP